MSLVEIAHAGAFDRADVNKDILAAVIGLNEAEALLAIEPLYRTLRHVTLLLGLLVGPGRAHAQPRYARIWRRSSVRRVARGEADSFGLNSIVDI